MTLQYAQLAPAYKAAAIEQLAAALRACRRRYGYLTCPGTDTFQA
jgi:hypothetical protein